MNYQADKYHTISTRLVSTVEYDDLKVAKRDAKKISAGHFVILYKKLEAARSVFIPLAIYFDGKRIDKIDKTFSRRRRVGQGRRS